MSGTGSGNLQSVRRALQVLEVVASSEDGVSAKHVAGRLDMPLPSLYHVLGTLVDAGYVVHVRGEHRYVLGYRVRMLDQALHRQLGVDPEVAAVVRWVHSQADAAAYYAVYRDVDVVLAHVVDSARRPRIQLLDVGFHEATHATAFGKVMLAAMPAERRRRYVGASDLRALTDATIVDPELLDAHLRHVRDAGVALEMGEFQAGVWCLAAPVRSPAGEVVAAVAVSMPSEEFRQRRWPVERAVRHGATRVTRALRAGP